MAKTRAALVTDGFEYDFSLPGNGTVGIHTVPLFFPEKSFFIFGTIFCVTTLVGAAAELDFGNANGNFHTGTTLPIADFGQGIAIQMNNFSVNSPDTNSYIIMSGLPLLITITTAPVTSGIIKFVVNSQQFA